MLNQFSRTRLIFGIEAMEKLSQARVAVFGIGGVGSYTAEALVRSGIGAIDLIDDDRICLIVSFLRRAIPSVNTRLMLPKRGFAQLIPIVK